MLMRELPPIDLSGTKIKIDSAEDLIMKESAINGVFTEADARTELTPSKL